MLENKKIDSIKGSWRLLFGPNLQVLDLKGDVFTTGGNAHFQFG